jgi:hypothetical protein
MRTKIHSSSDYFANSIQGFRKLSNPIVKPLKAGFLGFITILMIIIVINLLSFVIGSNEKFRIDSLIFF